MLKKIVLAGYGNVGRKFVELLKEKREYIKNKYDINFLICGVTGSVGTIYEDKGLDLDLLLGFNQGSEGILKYSEKRPFSFSKEILLKGDVLVEATPTNLDSGEPGFGFIMGAIEEGMDIVSISKGALVTNFSKIFEAAGDRGIRVKFSGATAAALPTLDIGEYSLAGCKILSIRGILNGTSNYILNRMKEDNMSFEEALKEARVKGIAETNSKLDTSGMDSACKILLLSNSLLDMRLSISDIEITGIEEVSFLDMQRAGARGAVIKLIAKVIEEGGSIKVRVKPEEVFPGDLLYGVDGTNKGIVFNTDVMGEVAALGGASNPRGAAAAALKDMINLYI